MASLNSTSSPEPEPEPEPPRRPRSSLIGSLRQKLKGLTRRTPSLSRRIHQASLSGSSRSPPARISPPSFYDYNYNYRMSSDSSSRTSKSLSNRPSTLPRLDFRGGDDFRLLEEMYGLPGHVDLSPTRPRMPIRIAKPHSTKAPCSSPVELPAGELVTFEPTNSARMSSLPRSATEHQLTVPLDHASSPVPSVELFNFLDVRGFDRDHVGSDNTGSVVGTDGTQSLRYQGYWEDRAMPTSSSRRMFAIAKNTGDKMLGDHDSASDHNEATNGAHMVSNPSEKGVKYIAVEDDSIDQDEDEDMAVRLGGLV